MTWGFVGVAAVGALTGNIAANKASNAAKSTANSAKDAADAQILAGQEASTLLDPFQAIGQQGLDQSGFLTDPTAQFDFLQNNPLFQLGLDNANQQTQKSAASRGRLSAGDTLQQLSNNALLVAQPLIAGQKQSIGDLINTGVGVAGSQGNLRTGQGAAEAGGIVGARNALNQGVQADINNINSLGALAGGLIPGLFGATPPPAAPNNFSQIGGQSPSTVAPFNPLLQGGG
jgi:hypothetical protein